MSALAALLLAQGCTPVNMLLNHTRANFERYHLLREDSSATGVITARFLGTSSLLLQDGDTAILHDGFVTRPRQIRVVLGHIRPDTRRVGDVVDSLGHTPLAAVFTSHSHYDHAMDSPIFAKLTDAVLVGSGSVANVAYGVGLDSGRIRVVEDGDTMRFGKFRLTFVESMHGPGDMAPGTIPTPLVPPAHARAWKTGATYSVLVEHGDRTILIHGSAGYRPGALQGRCADVVYLGIALLGKQTDEFVDAYWNEVVRATGARRVILVHWDDFFRSLDEPLVPMRNGLDPTEKGLRHILYRAAADGVQVVLPVAWQPTDPFAGLPQARASSVGQTCRR